MHATSYETWMESIGDKTAYADELVLYSLCKLYDRHAMVYCNGHNWSTIDPTNPMDAAELHDACPIQLVYLSLGIFGELKWRPFVTLNREFRTALNIRTAAQTDGATPLPVNLSKDDSVKPAAITQSGTDDTKNDKTDEVYSPIVEPITPEPPESYQPVVEPIGPVQNVPDRENEFASGMTSTVQSINEVAKTTSSVSPIVEPITPEPPAPYQPVVELISPAQNVPEGENKIAAGETSLVQLVDDVATTTPPGSPPVTLGRDDGRPNTDDIDTEEYEDSISDNNIINGSNTPSDNEPIDTATPTDTHIGCNTEHMNGDNIDSNYDGNNINMDNDDPIVTNINSTTDVNVVNSPPQLNTGGDNKTFSSNVDNNHNVVNGNNNVVVVQNKDTNGPNVLEADSTPIHHTDMNSHNINDPTLTNFTENRRNRSPSPHSSSANDVPEKSPITDPHREIHIYGSVKVHNQVLDLWLYEAETRKTYVSVPKMSDEDIKKWTDPESLKPSWQDLDPYSSLKEIISDDNNNQVDIDNPSYNMRERKPKNISSHPQCNRKDINYIDLCDDNTDPPSLKRPKRRFNSLKEPSTSRIAAQSKITEHKLECHAVDLSEQSDAADPDGDTNNNETPPYMPEVVSDNKDVSKSTSKLSTQKPKPRPRPASKPPPKGSHKESPTTDMVSNESRPVSSTKNAGQLVTTDHKLKQSNKPHTFRCQQCASKCNTQGKMNEHFRSSHLPVKCPECDDTFTTPNTLARHCYTHGELTKVCRDCDKKFAFAHELKIHQFSHRQHPAFKCTYLNCDKAFFREGELTKHAKIHKKIIWKCKHCEYESYDECNLKGHVALHSKIKKHACTFCTACLTFYMQLLRHVEKRQKLGVCPIVKQKT